MVLGVKNLPGKAGDVREEIQVQSLGQEDPLEEGIATHASTPACRVLRSGALGGLQSTGSHRVRHD